MDYQELQQMPEKELHVLLAEKRNALREYRFGARARQLKQVHLIQETKKIVSRILTALRNKETSTPKP